MKRKKIIWSIVIVVILATALYAYNEFNRKHVDLMSVASQDSITAEELAALYEKSEEKANGLYLGKPIDVTGIISEINNQGDTTVNLMLGRDDALHRVSCLIDVAHLDKVKKCKPGDSITIRGICTGYLLDVELNRCVVVR